MLTCVRRYVHLEPNGVSFDGEYADGMVLLSDCLQEAQNMVNSISQSVLPSGKRFAPAECKVRLQSCKHQVDLTLNNEPLEVVNTFTDLGSCITRDVSAEVEIRYRITKARMAFINLMALERCISTMKGCVYDAAVRTVLFYGCET